MTSTLIDVLGGMRADHGESRLTQHSVSIERLVTSGAYIAAEKSQFLPIRPEDISRWIWDEEQPGRPGWKRRLRDWARDELV